MSIIQWRHKVQEGQNWSTSNSFDFYTSSGSVFDAESEYVWYVHKKSNLCGYKTEKTANIEKLTFFRKTSLHRLYKSRYTSESSFMLIYMKNWLWKCSLWSFSSWVYWSIIAVFFQLLKNHFSSLRKLQVIFKAR